MVKTAGDRFFGRGMMCESEPGSAGVGEGEMGWGGGAGGGRGRGGCSSNTQRCGPNANTPWETRNYWDDGLRSKLASAVEIRGRRAEQGLMPSQI